MTILFILVPLALLISFGFLLSFMWASKSGQYDDLDTPQHQILMNDNERETK